ncbi:P-loop containing nucleoside triphosphate hydrolase [Fusarium albosuccineum]|uniref:P-loop containing nucleoside triphosphate hydrolase n=1 Tax=Fusarium albosuccineum TaxID=1237068 RepID=A0A8H4KLU3_9HYPO|nr:P-loop containing nucleoside triphosphate hydrolase [Fusarium albosuccineum]
MESVLEDVSIDWTSPLPPQPINPCLQGAGAKCETKRFDSFYNTCGDRVVLPAGQKYTAGSGRAYESALVVTTYWDREQDLEKTVLEIKSPHMKAALKAVVPKYRSFNITARHINLTGEPQCLFHYRQELADHGAALQQEQQNDEAARHVKHLISYMWEVFAAEIEAFNMFEFVMNNFGDEPTFEHKYLWMVFRPGDIVYVREPEHKAFLFEEMNLRGKWWSLSGHCIDYDGELFGFKSFQTTIDFYDGVKPLRELHAVNFNYLPGDEKQIVRDQLIARGRRFVSIHGQQCLWYNGESHRSPGSRVRNECYGMLHIRFDFFTNVGIQMKTRIIADRKGYDSKCHTRVCLSAEKKKFKPEDASGQMTETDLIMCGTSVAGYSLRDNEWDTFDIDSISEVTFDTQAFDALILPDDQKQQILSLVSVHENERFSFDDLVKGKGKGMVFLLYGDPGVGKTLTAESVADYCRKPLLRLDAGTLGTSASSVERGLQDAFDLAEKWHALLLLDEADVYLEQRKSKNLVHNGIVSVFLRMLEYYHGILFLTTNRITSFDRAFMSRIHLAIEYKPLSQSSRLALLYTFLKQTSDESAETLSRSGFLVKVSEEELNGRQIKNLVRTACALALSDVSAHGHIDRSHLESALRPMKQFTQTMGKVLLYDEQQELTRGDDDEVQQVEDQPSDEGSERSDMDDEYGSEDEEGNTDAEVEPDTEIEPDSEVEVVTEDEVDTEDDEQDEEDRNGSNDEEPDLRETKRIRTYELTVVLLRYDVRLHWLTPETGLDDDRQGSPDTAYQSKSRRSQIAFGSPDPPLPCYQVDDILAAIDTLKPRQVNNGNGGGVSQFIRCFGVFDPSDRPLDEIEMSLQSPATGQSGVAHFDSTYSPPRSTDPESLSITNHTDASRECTAITTLSIPSITTQDIPASDYLFIDPLLSDGATENLVPFDYMQQLGSIDLQANDFTVSLSNDDWEAALNASIPRCPSPAYLSSKEQFLMHHYVNRVVHLFCTLDNPKSPWKTIHLPRALQSAGELTIQGSTWKIRGALRSALISISAFCLSNDNKVQLREDESLKWASEAMFFRGSAIKLLKETVESESLSKCRPKYKELLATMLSMISINVGYSVLGHPYAKY